MSNLETIEHEAAERLAEEDGRLEADLERAEETSDEQAEEAPVESSLRVAIAVAFPVMAAGVMVGGVFTGVGARFYAVIAGLLGVALAAAAGRFRKPLVANVAVAVGLFAIGLLMVIPSGAGNVGALRGLVSEAASSGDVLRPPVPLTAGWQAIIGWLMGIVGFVATWLATVVGRGSLALLVPLPIAAIAGISVPNDQQVGSGLAVLVLFAIGLGMLSSAQAVGEGDERPPLAYEVRKALKSLPLIAAITVALYFLAQADFLFPDPAIDPTQEPQKPKTVPLSQVEDRVLFEVESSISGPWRTGSLDVYDGKDWRLPPFAENSLEDVPRDGIVDKELAPGVRAKFTVAGLGGTVLPGLPNMVGIVAEGPRLAYDDRNGNIRVAQGQVQAGLVYNVTAAALPSIDELKAERSVVPDRMRRFASIPIDPPPAMQTLLDQAKSQFPDRWQQFDFIRTYLLDNVTAAGPGIPKSIDGERVQDMLAGSKEGSPFEIVASQAMAARWLGLPSRIGYGFDGGELIGERFQVRPANGATFVEVYFPSFKWLPVIGTPRKAKPTVGGEANQQQFDPSVLPADEASVELFLPVLVPPESPFGRQVQRVVMIVVPVLLLLLLLYVTFPILRKAVVRARRRAAAERAGPRARIALAYAEFRDYATDFGFRHSTDTPLMFLDRFLDDPEHIEFAWLVTRALWGDLQDVVAPDMATAAEELSRSLRRRVASAQPATVRAVALVSRLSLRNPYAPETDLTGGRRLEEDVVAVPA